MKTLGVVLMVLGLLALIYQGFSYTRERKVLDVGPIEASVNERRVVPIPPIAGGAAILIGAALYFSDRRRRA